MRTSTSIGDRAADAVEGPLLQHAQELALRRRRQLADLVQEDRSRRRPARTCPSRRAAAPVNAPRSWPKSSLSSSVSGIAAQLIATNGRSRRVREHVDRPREELLARAALALEQDRRVRRGDPLGLRADGLRSAADSPTICGICRDAPRRREATRAAFARRSIARATSRRSRSGSTGFVMKSSAPRFIASTAVSIEPKAVMTTTGSVESDRAGRLEDREPVGSGQSPVGQHDVDGLRPSAAARRPPAVARGPRRSTLRAQHLLEHRAQRVLVLDDQDGRHLRLG